MSDCLMIKAEIALEEMDRRASMSLVLGQKVEIDAMQLRLLVRAARGIAAAKAAYNHEREKSERREMSLVRGIYFALALAASVMAISEAVGLL